MTPRLTVIQIRVSPYEKKAYRIAAAASGLSLSAWMRQRLMVAAKRVA